MRIWGNVYWPWYLLVANIAWMVPELYAVFTNKVDTLSYYCWRELDVNSSVLEFSRHTFAWYASFAGWATFVVIITMHIWFRGL